MQLEEARNLVLARLQKGTKITAALDHDTEFMFIAIRPDELEGRFDPFFKVNKETSEFMDFSPQDYDDSSEIIAQLVAQAKPSG